MRLSGGKCKGYVSSSRRLKLNAIKQLLTNTGDLFLAVLEAGVSKIKGLADVSSSKQLAPGSEGCLSP